MTGGPHPIQKGSFDLARHHPLKGQRAAAVAQAHSFGLPARLVGLNRIVATCDLKRLGGFYRFLRRVLEQNATKNPTPGQFVP